MNAPTSQSARLARLLWLSAGGLFLLLGAVGIFLPIMPTVVFWLVAVACFGRSSPALEARMLNHPRFGGALRDFRYHGVISRRGKRAALIGMLLSVLLTTAITGSLAAAAITGTVLAAVALYVATRPEAVPGTDLDGSLPLA